MAFRPRQFPEIFNDMVNFVRANTRLTDFSVGSVVRTILEASAIEDDEQYFQMVQLLDAFSIRSASGAELDARVADYNVVRLQPLASNGNIVIQDSNLITDALAFDANATDTTITLDSTSRFPTSGYPYTIRIGEGTVAVEDVTVSNNDTGTNVLTVSALVNDHSLGDRVSVVSGVADVAIATGLQVQAPAAGDNPAVVFVSVETGVIVNGNYESTPIAVKALVPGLSGNVGAGRVSQFTSSPPFDGALVTNEARFTGGRAVESDSELRDRALDRLQALSRGTPFALKEAALGVTDPVTGKRISTASVLENFSDDEVIIYVDDGTGFVPDQVVLSRDALDTTYAVPTSTVSAADLSEFPSEGFALISPESAQAEVVTFSAVDYTLNNMTLVSPTVNTHDSGDEIVQVEVLAESSESGREFYTLAKFPTVRNSQRLWVGPSASSLTLMVEDVDYYINKARSRIEFLTPVAAGSFIAITYSYYTGLIFYVQRIINGSREDEVTYPGVVAAGIEATVETPIIRRITVRMSITAQEGFDEANLIPLVRTAVENYILALGIGEDVILSEIIERAMAVTGMYNVIVQEPTSDVSVASSELPVPVSASGASLVTVN